MTRRAGLLNVHKPEGTTSRRVVDCVERQVRPEKAGHAGTLDPMASGVLVVCVGQATRLIPYVQQQPKTYRAEFLLGVRSDTDDVTGTVVASAGCREVRRDELDAALPRFLGRIEQVPPRFSAVHVDGRRAYDLARRGEPVELKPKSVEVRRIEVFGFAWPRLDVEIECGSGTYIRSIARDLGDALGCGAVMSRLVRTRIGPFEIEHAVPLDALDAERIGADLQPLTRALGEMPRHVCGREELAALRQGKAIAVRAPVDSDEETQIACITTDGELAAIAVFQPQRNVLQPKQVFAVP